MHDLSLLYLEDDQTAREHYANGLKYLFNDIYEAGDVRTAWTLYDTHHPDILLIDINLPDGDGLDLIKSVRAQDEESTIIVLSAYSHRDQLFKAIELGLYKYLVKPIKNSELLKVIKGASQKVRQQKAQESTYVLNTQLRWNRLSYTLIYEDKEISLSLHENRLIELLTSNPKKIFSHDEIIDSVWRDEPIPSEQAMKNMLTRIRQKVPVPLIKNHYATGYQIIMA